MITNGIGFFDNIIKMVVEQNDTPFILEKRGEGTCNCGIGRI